MNICKLILNLPNCTVENLIQLPTQKKNWNKMFMDDYRQSPISETIFLLYNAKRERFSVQISLNVSARCSIEFS